MERAFSEYLLGDVWNKSDGAQTDLKRNVMQQNLTWRDVIELPGAYIDKFNNRF